MYGSPPPTKSPLIKRERRGEKDLLRWVTDVCNHERWDSPLNELGPFTKVKLLNHLSTICSATEGGISYDTFMEGKDEPLPPEERFEWPQGEAGSLL